MKQFAIMSSLLILFGCSTLKDTEQAQSQFQQFPADFDKVWATTLAVVVSSRLDVVSQDKSLGVISAQTGLSLLSYGENVQIKVLSQGSDSTLVAIASTPALVTNVTATDWSPILLARIENSYRL